MFCSSDLKIQSALREETHGIYGAPSQIQTSNNFPRAPGFAFL